MDYGAAFSYVFQDEDWIKKILIASVLALVGVLFAGLGFIPLIGWSVEISRRLIRGDTEVLPDWSDWGQLIMDGLKFAVGMFVWALPLIIVGACLAGISALAAGAMDDSETAATLALVLNACLAVLAIPYGILLGVMAPALLGRLAVADSFGQALRPGEALKLVRANLGGYLITVVAMVALSFVVPFGAIACVVGLFPLYAYFYAVLGHLSGQAYRQAQVAA
jgi:hypothetical protein